MYSSKYQLHTNFGTGRVHWIIGSLKAHSFFYRKKIWGTSHWWYRNEIWVLFWNTWYGAYDKKKKVKLRRITTQLPLKEWCVIQPLWTKIIDFVFVLQTKEGAHSFRKHSACTLARFLSKSNRHEKDHAYCPPLFQKTSITIQL